MRPLVAAGAVAAMVVLAGCGSNDGPKGAADLIATAAKHCGLEDSYNGSIIYLSNPTNDFSDSACVQSEVCLGAGLTSCPSLSIDEPNGLDEVEYLPGVWVGYRNTADQWSVIIWGSSGADVFAGG